MLDLGSQTVATCERLGRHGAQGYQSVRPRLNLQGPVELGANHMLGWVLESGPAPCLEVPAKLSSALPHLKIELLFVPVQPPAMRCGLLNRLQPPASRLQLCPKTERVGVLGVVDPRRASPLQQEGLVSRTPLQMKFCNLQREQGFTSRTFK